MRSFVVVLVAVALAAVLLVDAKPLKRNAKHAASKSLVHPPRHAIEHKSQTPPRVKKAHFGHAEEHPAQHKGRQFPFHPHHGLEEETEFRVTINSVAQDIELPYDNWNENVFWHYHGQIEDNIGTIVDGSRSATERAASDQWLIDHHHILWAALEKILVTEDPYNDGLYAHSTARGFYMEEANWEAIEERVQYIAGPINQICNGPLAPDGWQQFVAEYVYWFYARLWCPTHHAGFMTALGNDDTLTMRAYLETIYTSDAAWWTAVINPFFGPTLSLGAPELKYGAMNLPATLGALPYTLGAPLGRGDYGAVYAATNPNNDDFAIKMVMADYFVRWQEGSHPASLVEAPHPIAELRKECALMHRLHAMGGKLAHVVDCVDNQAVVIANTHAPRYIVLERIYDTGWTADETEVIPLMKQLVELVDAMSTARVAHRDLYARNIAKVVDATHTDGFAVKVYDFGIARENIPKAAARRIDYATLVSTEAGGFRDAAVQDGPITLLWRKFKDPEESDDDAMTLLRKKVKHVYKAVVDNKDPAEVFDFSGIV